MEFETILYDTKDKVLTVTLNRPERLNAFTGQMMDDLIEAFDKAGKDDEVRVGIKDNPEWMRDGGGRTTLAIFDCPKPIIAAFNGPAVGVGVTMTLPMDIRIASEEARFGFVFARRGLVPEAASSWFLPRIVGISKALEWTFSGKVFSAEEAKEGGLIRSVHPANKLMDEAYKLAQEIIDNTSPVSVALTRQMLWKMLGADHPMEAHKVDSRLIYELGKAEDAKEGVKSFLEKRSPKFPSKVSRDMPKFFPWWKNRKFE